MIARYLHLVLSYLIASASISTNFFFIKKCPWSDPLTILIYLSNHGNLNLWEELFGTFWIVHNNIKSYLCQVFFMYFALDIEMGTSNKRRWQFLLDFWQPHSLAVFYAYLSTNVWPLPPTILSTEMSFTQKFPGK